MPTPELCLVCHGEAQRASGQSNAPPVASLAEQPPRVTRQTPSALPAEIRFAHGSHARAAGLTCAACHGDIAGSDGLLPDAPISKDACMNCHAERNASNDCATCHREVRADRPPPTHARAWDVVHGDVLRSGDTASVNRCSLCHTETTSCRACHEQQAPRDHTHHWRLRSHGIAVSLDRSRCSTCHRSDFCQSCHESTRPLSHRGGFGSPQNRHCTTCHFPVRQEGCTTCHQGPSSHLLAAPMPAWHVPSMDCRRCHGRGTSLPHPDSGDACTTCHR